VSSTRVGHSSLRRVTEIRLAPESIETLACRLAELLVAGPPEPEARARKKMFSAAEVAELFGISRRWVYDHAETLGVRRLGAGIRPRLRFDPDEVAERIDGLAAGPGSRPAVRGSAAMRGDCRTDSLPARLVDSRRGQVAKGTTKHEEWTLSHLLPFFGEWALPEIDIEAVDEYRQFKVTEAESRAAAIERGRPKRNLHGQILRPLSPRSINRTISFLQWVLSIALEYGYVSHNAAAGRRRRLRERRPAPVHLDTAAQIEALLESAAGLDRDVRQRCGEREAIVATLVFAGPRAHELCGLRWRDVDLAGGRLFIGRSKTDAGLREIKMLPLLRDLLASHKAAAHPAGPEDLVFPSESGASRDPVNLRSRILEPTFKRADKLLVSRGLVPLPKGLTTHKLRHTFASVLIACGEDPISLMRQIATPTPPSPSASTPTS
jgi:integrase